MVVLGELLASTRRTVERRVWEWKRAARTGPGVAPGPCAGGEASRVAVACSRWPTDKAASPGAWPTALTPPASPNPKALASEFAEPVPPLTRFPAAGLS